MFQRLCQHRPGSAAQEAWHPQADRRRAHSTHLRGVNGALCGWLGYDVAVVKDAIVDYSDEHMHAALVTNLPNYASAIVSAKELVDSISSLQTLEKSA